MLEQKTIKASLHGHFLPDYQAYWRNEFNCLGQNLAEVVVDKLIKKGLGIAAVTDNPYNMFKDSPRFQQIWSEAENIKKPYLSELISDNLFVVRKFDNEVYFLDGQTIGTHDNRHEFEVLSFGQSKIPDKINIYSLKIILDDKGLPMIAEHPLMINHHGMGKDILEKHCLEKTFLAVEHNSQLALSDFPFSYLPKFKHYSRSKNKEAVKIAEKYGIPVIANDDSNGITHIGTSYTEFPKEKIRTDNGENLTQDLINLIKNKDFSIYKGHLSHTEWFAQASRYIIKEKIWKEKFDRKHQNII